MKSFTVTALGIAFKIWFIAVLINTIADTFLFGGISGDAAGIFFLIALFGGVFSAPIFLVIWALVYSLLKRGSNAPYILKWLLVAGIGLAIATWAVFTGAFHFLDNEMILLVMVAPISGAIAIGTGYSNIKKACIARDEDEKLMEGFDIAQATASEKKADIAY